MSDDLLAIIYSYLYSLLSRKRELEKCDLILNYLIKISINMIRCVDQLLFMRKINLDNLKCKLL